VILGMQDTGIHAGNLLRWDEMGLLLRLRASEALPCRICDAEPSAADTWNRRRDKRKVEARLGLTEFPQAGKSSSSGVRFRDRTGLLIAVGYERVLYGDHGGFGGTAAARASDLCLPACPGAYVEFSPEHVMHESWAPFHTGEYYNLLASKGAGSGCRLYVQKRSVSDRPNPPQGRGIAHHSRAEGYADYREGRFYLSVHKVEVELPESLGRWRSMAVSTTTARGKAEVSETSRGGQGFDLYLTCPNGREQHLMRELMSAFDVGTTLLGPYAVSMEYSGLVRASLRTDVDPQALALALSTMALVEYAFVRVAHGVLTSDNSGVETVRQDQGGPKYDEIDGLDVIRRTSASGLDREALIWGMGMTQCILGRSLQGTSNMGGQNVVGGYTFHVRARRGGQHAFSSDDAKRAAAQGIKASAVAQDLRLEAITSSGNSDLSFMLRIHYDQFWLGLSLEKQRVQPPPGTRIAFEPKTAQVPTSLEGELHLDLFAMQAFEKISSRSRAKRLAESGKLYINGEERRDRGRYVKAGDQVTLMSE
jgi:hypothetical protein